MNGCKNEDDCQTPTRCRHLSRCPNASSEEAAAETAGQVSSLALAPGSLPVSSVEALLLLWQQNAEETTNASYRAGILACIRDLRAVMEAAESSQPRENGEHEQRGPKTGDSQHAK